MALHEGAADLTVSFLSGDFDAMLQPTTAYTRPRNVSHSDNLASHAPTHDPTLEVPPVNDDSHLQVNHRIFPLRKPYSRHRHYVAHPVNTSAAPYSLQSENHLRRKTPGGTIDAAYDGTFAQPFLGPPPQKQINLQYPTGVVPYGASCVQVQASTAHIPLEANPLVHRGVFGVEDPRRSGLSLPYLAPCTMPMNASTHSPFLSAFQPSSNQPPNGYQPVLRAYERNVRAFCPPPVPSYGQLQFGMGWDAGALPWDYRVTGTSNGPVAMNNGYSATFPADQAVTEHQRINSTRSNASVEASGLIYGSEPLHQPGFKERALLQAHRSYIDLLAHAQATRKMHHTKRGNGDKLVVYPKPPTLQALLVSNCPRPVASSGTQGQSVYSGWGSRSHVVPEDHSADHHVEALGDSLAYRDFGQTLKPYHNAFAREKPPTPGYHIGGSPLDQPSSFDAPLTHMPWTERRSPMDTAVSSLEILKNICDQCGWNWISGMLLGGCLHYGLGNFQEALAWFSRVTIIDPCHVEAITDVATTLYSLDRQTEAEEQWLRAVKLRPSFLDASEHLVGLLYRKRTREAVEVIEYVQKALLISSPSVNPASVEEPGYDKKTAMATPMDWTKDTSNLTGFGSSGYLLPGCENGRILALVHAKGTMLYGLRDIDKAAQAFEEAVLISVGRRFSGIRHLVHRIHSVLSSSDMDAVSESFPLQNCTPILLLPPAKALTTARLVFSDTSGELPGLLFVSSGPPKRAASQTTSNSLLSLAKIFQDSMSSGGGGNSSFRYRSSGVGDILALYYLSLALQESPSTANNVGILLAGVQQGATIPPGLRSCSRAQSSIPGVPPGSGLALALSYYQYGLKLDPKHVHLHTNLGSLLKDLGQLDLAIQMYEQAVACDGTFDIALTNLANAVKDKGRIKDAIMYYKRAVQSNPNFSEAVCGLSTALNSVCDWKGRGGVLLYSGRYDRWHVNEAGMLIDGRSHGCGSGLMNRVVTIARQQLQDAGPWGRNILNDDFVEKLLCYLRALGGESTVGFERALKSWKGQPWEGTRVVRLLERATRAAMRKQYCAQYLSSRAYPRPSIEPPKVPFPTALSIPSAPTVLPFHTFTYPLGPRDIRMISQRNAMRISCSTLKSSWLPQASYTPPPPPAPHLNVGYVSSDFNNHPLAHLMQSVFGFHDPSRVRAICYATTPSDRSSHRRKIEDEAPVFRDASGWSSDKLVKQIVADEVHILVNLNGYTRGARNEIFAARPAPVQMSFMGFAGTIGAEWCDYILADTTAIPPETLRPWRDNAQIESVFQDGNEDEGGDWLYSENIIFCRDTFFCCDHAQSCDDIERRITWDEEKRRRWQMRKNLFPSLPDDMVIFGNFNQLYKIEPSTFRCWLRILSRVPNAILWLLRFPELGESNLRRTAELWAGQEVASRLVFTDVAPKDQHISRARVCDLFLDTPECNAHTTAADVLWSSTPLLTLPRYPYKMCSRMAASILKGALPKSQEGHEAASDLIADSEDSYEQLAVSLASGLKYKFSPTIGYGEGYGRLAEIRHLLWGSKWQCALFNTRRWVADVETAYEKAWQCWVAGHGGDIYL